jgi:putative ABC transport system permease protein
MQQAQRTPHPIAGRPARGTLLGQLALPVVIWRRLASHLGLMLTVWAGVVLAVAIVVSIPVYAESAGYRILLSALADSQSSQLDTLSPFAMIYRYGGASAPPVSWQQYAQGDATAMRIATDLGLPTTRAVRYASTEKLRVAFPDGQGKELMFARLAFMSGIREQIRILDGEWPRTWDGNGPIEVLVAETTASKNTILVGDEYRLQGGNTRQSLDIPIRIAGIWRAINPNSDYWFQTPSALSDQLLLDEPMFKAIVSAPDTQWVAFASWYAAIDGRSVRSAQVSGLIDRIQSVTADLNQVLPGAQLARSPSEALERHKEQVRLLIVTLALFSVPLLALILYFVVQVAGFVIQRQQQEVAVLRSRGSSRGQVLLLALGESIILGIAALLAGVPLGVLVAQAIAWTQSFLRFAALPGPPPELLPSSWLHGALAAALVIPAMLLPALSASKRTIVSFKQERARDLRAPLWQRLFLDILFLIPALYGFQQLRTNGMIGVPGVSASPDDPFSNPLLLLAPALLIFALALLALRIFPRFLSLLAWTFGRMPGIALVTALRFLARTLDQQSRDRAHYQAGADARMASPGATIVTGGSLRNLPRALFTQSSSGAPQEVAQEISNDYFYIPMEEYLTIPGVESASRVAPSKTSIAVGQGSPDDALFYGVDSPTLAAVLADSWRRDYADETLGALINHLAESPQSALVSKQYAQQVGLRLGDNFTIELNDNGTRQNVPLTVAGFADYFPTLYPVDQPFVIGNLDYSFDQQGGTYDFEVWLDLAPDASIERVEASAYGYGLRVLTATPDRLQQIDTLRPERQGLFGLLSVGFIATALVTVIGFLTYTMFSFQRRLVELGVLRAIGLGTRQLATLLVTEQTLVVGIGTLLGTGFGIVASRLFLPFLQVRTGDFPDTPPFLVHIAWGQIALVYAVAGVMLVATIAATLLLLRRMRIFEAVKLGEAV